MGSVGERKAPWHSRLVIHLILLTGAVFFLLPLIWMIAASLKPLDQTLQKPESITTAFFATGYWTDIGGKEYEVTLVRAIDPAKEGTLRIVRPRPYAKGVEPFRAGELTLPFGPSVWQGSPSFTDDELKQMNARVTVDQTVLADEANPFRPGLGPMAWLQSAAQRVKREESRPPDTGAWAKLRQMLSSAADRLPAMPLGPRIGDLTQTKARALARQKIRSAADRVLAWVQTRRPDLGRTGLLELKSGRTVAVDVVKTITAAEAGKDLWLVREWRPIDTDTKGMASPFVNVERAWDIVPRSQIRTGPKVIPENYPVALRRVHFARSLLNTLMVCALTVCGTVVSSVIVAYGFAFLRFPGRNGLFALTLMTIMIPFVVTMIPVYLMYRDLGWVGTFKPLWVATWFGNAFFIFLLRQFFLGIPTDLLDAARIDGCSELEILWNVVVPLSRPVIAMVALFMFLGTWKDFLGPLIYLNHESQFTLSLALQTFQSEHGGTPWHLLMAASTVFSLPLIILFFFAMKTFIRSVAMTGLKG